VAATPEPTASDLFGDEPNDAALAAAPPLPPVVGPATEQPAAYESIEQTPAPEEPVVDALIAPSHAADDPLPEPPPAKFVTAQQRLDAWTVASAWSLATAVHAKGLGPDRYASFLADAERAAASLGLDLPALPTADAEEEREATVIAALQTGAGAELVAAIAAHADDAAGAAAQLALDSHRLLLVYTPQRVDGPTVAAAIRAAGRQASLPDELWQPLVALVERRADFKSVRGAVFALHKAVAQHLAGKAQPAPPLAREGSGG
jgi:hypothetical protein